MNDHDKIIDLESRLTYMDDTVEQLNQIVSEQQLKIDFLERQLKQIASDYNEFKEQLAPDIVDTKPPHY
ncbi:SlyX family protein [Reinekea thalattae]|uniref:SlyX family protein n=1 Tax=Reinekea thalattae TaxID=2593301 RepID=A0A5C8Z927_9GAMM|nr:SlyX family protein [Reinekea thalattae]TXR53779.1 SlyX family protein [Reinekea thalattae]